MASDTSRTAATPPKPLLTDSSAIAVSPPCESPGIPRRSYAVGVDSSFSRPYCNSRRATLRVQRRTGLTSPRKLRVGEVGCAHRPEHLVAGAFGNLDGARVRGRGRDP